VEENETDVTDINHLIYAMAKVITETIIKPGKTMKNIRNTVSYKIITQRKKKQLQKIIVHTC
jgi:hypothetical protein